MNLKFLLFATLVAAMGPGRDAPPPDPDTVGEPATAPQAASRAEPARNPARLPPVTAEPAPPAAPQEPPTEASATPELTVITAADAEPGQFLWQQRPIVVFADTPGDPAFNEQMRMLTQGAATLIQRDAVVVTDTDPAANSIWRQQLRPSGFSLVILDKDGQVKQRKPSPWTVREIGRAIDRFPLRRQEMGRAAVLP